MNFGDYDWTNWSIPGFAAEAESGEKAPKQTQKPSSASQVPNLGGRTRAEAQEALEEAGFVAPDKPTPGGYAHWKHPDGSEVVIGSDGVIDRLPNAIDKLIQGVTGKGWRLDSDGKIARPHSFPEERLE